MKRPGLISALLLACLSLGARALPDGPYRILCLLVEFEDVHFSSEDPTAYFDAILNEEGCRLEGASGSVRDYFAENSQGRFVPAFTLEGPLRLEKKMQDYGRNVYDKGVRTGDAAAEQVIPDALALLGDRVRPEDYDALYFIYAGYDESRGGPADAIWAHQGQSARWGDYACSAEFALGEGTLLSGIGPVCHELGHLLGLPDFYDTDGAANGQAAGPELYSLMATGGHNREGRQPPYLNALELYLLDWMDEIPELPEGWVELPPVSARAAFRCPTQTEGEFFLLECRGGTGWDSGLPGGLLLYHVDRSDLRRWDEWRLSNRLNADASHPCFYPVRSSAPALSLKADAAMPGGNLVFPGLSRNYCHEPKDWKGAYCGVQLTNISWDGEKVGLYVLKGGGAQVNGIVRDGSGKALQGAVVTLEGVDSYALSDADGFFSLPLPENALRKVYMLTATMADCRPARIEVAMGGERTASAPVVLHKSGEAEDSMLAKYDPRAQFGYFPQASLGAVRFSPEDLAPHAGSLLSEIAFYPYMEPSFSGEVFVTVDIGGERVLCRTLEQPAAGQYFRNAVDVSDAGIVIPEGVEVYVGYGSAAAGEGFYVGTVYPAAAGNSFWSELGPEPAPLKPLFVEKGGFYMDVALSARVKEQADAATLDALGYAWILDPGRGQYRAGERFLLRCGGLSSEVEVRWLLDGNALAGDSVELPEGRHVIRAELAYPDGRKERLSLKIDVL